MSDSALIKNINGVLYVPVNKMHPEIGTMGGPTWAPLDQTVDWWGHTSEFQPVFQWGGRDNHCRGCGRITSQPSMLSYHVGGQ